MNSYVRNNQEGDPRIVLDAGRKLKDMEKEIIETVYMLHSYNKVHTARALGIGLSTLHRKLRRYKT